MSNSSEMVELLEETAKFLGEEGCKSSKGDYRCEECSYCGQPKTCIGIRINSAIVNMRGDQKQVAGES